MIQGPCLLGDSTPDGRWLSAVKNQYMVAGGGGLSVGLVLGQRPKKPPRGVLESPLGKGHAAIALSTLNTHRPTSPPLDLPTRTKSAGEAGCRSGSPREALGGGQGLSSQWALSLLGHGQRSWGYTCPRVQPVLPHAVTGERPPKDRLGSRVGDGPPAAARRLGARGT